MTAAARSVGARRGERGSLLQAHGSEEGSGLYYYRLRYYDPAAGRFVSRDPLGMWGDPGQVGNGQSYCGNNAVNYVDPLGDTSWISAQGPGYDDQGGGSTPVTGRTDEALGKRFSPEDWAARNARAPGVLFDCAMLLVDLLFIEVFLADAAAAAAAAALEKQLAEQAAKEALEKKLAEKVAKEGAEAAGHTVERNAAQRAAREEAEREAKEAAEQAGKRRFRVPKRPCPQCGSTTNGYAGAICNNGYAHCYICHLKWCGRDRIPPGPRRARGECPEPSLLEVIGW